MPYLKSAAPPGQVPCSLPHPGANWGPLYSLSQLDLARSAAAVQAEATARKSYQAFLNLWRDADPGRPAFIQARKELSLLRQ
jgi:hypothetical protein